MPQFLPPLVRWLSDWRRFCTLLLSIFLARAVFVLSVLPPFEGWDEYQHLAYIAHVVEKGESPVWGEGDQVPRSLYATLVRYPHCKLSMEQIGPIGARGYDSYWDGDRPSVRPDAGPVPLYQAQQAPLYYWLAAPLFRLFCTPDDALAAITVLRLVNVLLGGGAVLIALAVVGKIVREGAERYILGLLIALQPLFLLNCTRVANDALAVFLGTAAVAAMLVVMPRHYWAGVLLGGTALGLGILAKATDMALVPFVLFAFVTFGWQKQLTRRRAALGAVVVLGLAAAITYHSFSFNLRHFGVLTPAQEMVLNHRAGKTLVDAFRAAVEVDWWHKFMSRCFKYSLWFGGWSWLAPGRVLREAHACNLYLAIAGLLLAFSRRARRERMLFVDAGTGWRLLILCLGAFAGLAYHTIHTQMAWGTVASNSWYVAVAFPWLLCLYCQGIAFYPARWIPRALALLLVGTYLAAEIHGTLDVMIRAYTGHGWGPIAGERLAMMHPWGLGPAATIPALGLAIILTMVATAVWVRNEHRATRAVAG
jgi:hypothetical protein